MKLVTWALLAVMILLLAGAVIFIFSGTYDIAASTPQSDFEHWLFETITEKPVEARANDTTRLDLTDTKLIWRGFVHCDARPLRLHEPAHDTAHNS